MAQGQVNKAAQLEGLDEYLDESASELDEAVEDAKAAHAEVIARRDMPMELATQLGDLANALATARRHLQKAWDTVQSELDELDELDEDGNG